MDECAVPRSTVDVRLTAIAYWTTEVLKTIMGRMMGDRRKRDCRIEMTTVKEALIFVLILLFAEREEMTR